MLWRRHYPEAQAAGKAKGRQEAHEARGARRDSAGSVSRGPQNGHGAGVTMQRDVKKSMLREYFESIVIAVILALFIRTFVVQAFKIPTGSMEENLLIGDHLLVNKFIYGPTAAAAEKSVLPIAEIKRGDVLVFKYPVEPDRDFIKRVIGLPGETVEVKERKIYINGKLLDEPYVHFLQEPVNNSEFHEVTSFDVRERYGPVTVPANQL